MTWEWVAAGAVGGAVWLMLNGLLVAVSATWSAARFPAVRERSGRRVGTWPLALGTVLLGWAMILVGTGLLLAGVLDVPSQVILLILTVWVTGATGVLSIGPQVTFVWLLHEVLQERRRV